MSTAGNDQPTLDDVIVPEEQAVPDRHAHGKIDKHRTDEDLQRRAEHESADVHGTE